MTHAIVVSLLRAAASAAALTLWACSGDNFAPGPIGVSQVLVSAPVAGTVTDAQMEANRIRVPGRVYVALPPGFEPAGTSVSIRNGEEAPITVPVVDGGFDPVAIEAEPDDSLLIEVTVPGGSTIEFAKVPLRSRPVVVRTAPAHRRTDVVLNPVIGVVFNEPMRGVSLTSAVRLRRNGTDVPGTVTPLASSTGDTLAVAFVPAGPLASGTTYQVHVSQEALAVGGTPLAEAAVTEFTTGAESGPATASGTLDVVTETSGESLDADGFTFSIDGGSPRPIGTRDLSRLMGLSAGPHTIAVTGLSPNCTLMGASTQQVTVVAGFTIEIRFRVTCSSPAAATLVLETRTTGTGTDPDGYAVKLTPSQSTPVAASQTLEMSMQPGFYSLEISGLSGNCRLTDLRPWRDVTLPPDASVTVRFDIICTPDFTPSGRLAFARPTGTGRSAIFVANADGTGEAQLTDGLASDSDPAWSPDGARLAFISTREGEPRLYVMSADGTNVVRRSLVRAHSPSWAPDGRRLAFGGEWGGGVFIVDVDGDWQNPVRVGDDHTWDPAWSPNGTEIIFSSNVRDWFVTDIYAMRPDGAALGPRVEGPAGFAVIHYYAPAWSPDAGRISMTHSEMGSLFWLAVANADGSGLADVAVGGRTPAWSPDGSVIAFGSDRDCRQSGQCIRFVRPDGSGSSATIENAFAPAWKLSP